ncbi:MAG: four helix bundle protein [Ignavibacterium sp.]|jgi:four helix bundle protein|nr:four helix bundle protein [Ignavibacterium sp.]
MLDLSHKKLDVWKKSVELVSEVYKFTSKFLSQEHFALTSQIRQAAISIPLNISERNIRSSNLETLRFLDIARASAVELDTRIEIAVKLDYLNCTDIKQLAEMIKHSFAMLSKFIKKN